MLYNYQRTLKNIVSCTGIGLHSGAPVTIKLGPNVEDGGVVFKRTDIEDKNNLVKANYRNVTNTMLGTTVSNPDGISVATIEHLMAALWGCGIDNALVEVNGPEIPIMDGSSEPFVFLIECAGVSEQDKTRKVIEVLKKVEVTDKNSFVSINPAEQFSVSLEIEFEQEVIANQRCVFDTRDFSFKNDLCRARTFGFEHEVKQLRSMGLARGGSLDNAIVVSGDKVLNEGGLRYNDEFVRHKVLDCIGDVSLAGGYIQGHIHGFRSGHALNNQLLHHFFDDQEAFRVVRMPETSRPTYLV